MDDKINWSKFNEEKDSYIVAKYLPTRYSLTTKGETVREPNRQHLNQGVTVIITSNGTRGHMCPLT